MAGCFSPRGPLLPHSPDPDPTIPEKGGSGGAEGLRVWARKVLYTLYLTKNVPCVLGSVLDLQMTLVIQPLFEKLHVYAEAAMQQNNILLADPETHRSSSLHWSLPALVPSSCDTLGHNS